MSGERALMLAVLEDAIGCLAGVLGPRGEREHLAYEARVWLESRDRLWPFSFENICEGLGLDVDRLRARLLRDAPAVLPAPPIRASAPGRPRLPLGLDVEIVQMVRAGHPLRVVAQTFGISISKASLLSCGLASQIKAERDEEIRALRSAGWTHRALGQRFALSRVRIMRICARRPKSPEPAHAD